MKRSNANLLHAINVIKRSYVQVDLFLDLTKKEMKVAEAKAEEEKEFKKTLADIVAAGASDVKKLKFYNNAMLMTMMM